VLDIRNLERRWFKYKLKSYAPYVGATLIVVITLLATSLVTQKGETTTPSTETPPPHEEKKSSTTPKDEEKTPLLEPSMDFVQSFYTSTAEIPTVILPVTQTVKPPHQSVPDPKVLNVPEFNSPKSPHSVIPTPSGDKSFSLNRNESKIDIENIEHRFKETSNPNLGLFIARYHYDHGNYSEAYNYSLKTNSLNSKIEESWIIFAKSLVKLGKVEQAKKTLHLYISESNSESGRSLLDSIERGTFK
jgi:hypothetical protein